MVSECVNCANLPLVAHCLAPRLHQRRALCPGSAQRGRARHQLAVLFQGVAHLKTATPLFCARIWLIKWLRPGRSGTVTRSR